ncbi:nucleotidyltransferase family protein [Streptomyces sp. G-G2]|uniref:nucleotidyltransferase family protein n=1 Tax=Streptomyces sp. G-G2 TaxID=3046201 RepID=UPI0024B9587D|nr:nucleotidyltransferase family protein [Streptomyces sp. G-G2]MDJ0381791.1 nucleotidyltransferase family protein [Streptomyces sp. G-G2]
MDLALLYDVLDVSEDFGPGYLLFAARKQHYTLPYLVLSALAREGAPMSEAARGELARAQRRAAHYEAVLERVAAEVPVRPVKGPLLARAYPPDLLRPQGDLDLVTVGEPDLWRAVRLLMADRPRHVGVSVLGAPERHVVVTLSGPAEDPLLDPELRVEVATAALVGDQGAVPIRAVMPADVLTSNLLALAEERFQRPFHPRDAIDLHQLGRSADLSAGLSPPELVAAASLYHLAPELAELLAYAQEKAPLGALAPLVGDALAAAADAERARRAAVPADAPLAPGAEAALAAGVPLYGMPLRRTEEQLAARAGWERARVHRFGGDEALLLTPVGDYLLVTGELVGQEQYDAALRELDGLAGESA